MKQKEVKNLPEVDPKKAECVKAINIILEEYGFELGVIGFSLVPKFPKK